MRQQTRLALIERKLAPPDSLRIIMLEGDRDSQPKIKQRGALVVKLADVQGLQIKYSV